MTVVRTGYDMVIFGLRWVFSTPSARRRREEAFLDWAEERLDGCIADARAALPDASSAEYGPLAWALFDERYMGR